MVQVKQILRSLKRSKLFTWINITGLSIGLAISIMLLLFVVNEFSYDKHFKSYDRIVNLNSIWNGEGNNRVLPICLRTAYTDLPKQIPEIEYAVQLYQEGSVELIYQTERFQDVPMLYADKEFFKVFDMQLIDGTPETALESPQSAVVTDRYAKIIFGDKLAVGQSIKVDGSELTISAVVKELPVNTHFSFGLLVSLAGSGIDQYSSLEFYTYYLLKPNADVEATMKKIADVYSAMLNDRFKPHFANAEFGGISQRLEDVYLFSKADTSLGYRGEVKKIILLTVISVLILILAIANFASLFIVQSEKRMLEIGIRKANGSSIREVGIQFFSEATGIILLSFIIGIALSVAVLPYFSSLVGCRISYFQLFSPVFVFGIVAILLVTIVLSASYSALYLSRFNALDIINKRVNLSKRRLVSGIVIFQSVISIVLISYSLIVQKQTGYLLSIPIGYNPKQVMMFDAGNLASSYKAIRQELQSVPMVKMVSGGSHYIGGGVSGQGMKLFGEGGSEAKSIAENRVQPGLCELMGLELSEGVFFEENAPNNSSKVVLNQAAVQMLNMQPPYVGQQVVMWKDPLEVIGVAKNFRYGSPDKAVAPLVLTCYNPFPWLIYVRFDESVSRAEASQLVQTAMRKFDPEFIVNPTWSEDIYNSKLSSERRLSKMLIAGSLMAIFISMLGLLAIHSFTTLRRTKEVGIRRINGATTGTIFRLLSVSLYKWVAIAGVIAIPIAYYFAHSWLQDYANRAAISWYILLVPVLLQGLLATLTTLAVSMRAALQNPVNSIKSE